MVTELKVGVVGCGGHAESHFREIADEPRLHLAAIAEIDPERLERAAAAHKPDSVFHDYQDMLQRTELDVVYVETMPGHLLPIGLACLEEGINTSVEKSPGMNSGETAAMAEAAAEESRQGDSVVQQAVLPADIGRAAGDPRPGRRGPRRRDLQQAAHPPRARRHGR